MTDAGIDFVVKNGGGSSQDLSAGRPVSILFSQGKYVPGEKAEQWRGEGHAEKIPLSQVLEKIPHYTITSMVASKRFAAERSQGGSEVGNDECMLHWANTCTLYGSLTTMFTFCHYRSAS